MPGRIPILIVVGLAACTWALVLMVAGTEVGPEFAKPFSIVVGVIAIALAAFDRWIWRWPVVRRLVGRPDIEGTYRGELRSEWVDPETGSKQPPISAAFVVTQTYTGLSFTLFTPESHSSTITATLDTGGDGRVTVTGIYRNEPRLPAQDRSRIHHGGIRLQVSGPGTRLHGSYWTDRGTHGELDVSRVSRERARDFDEAAALSDETGTPDVGE